MEENEIMGLMDNIKYGWVDNNNKKHENDYDSFPKKYKLQSPEEIIKSQIGLCWDQVELERYYFENSNITVKTFFIVHYDNDKCPTHTFLVFEKDNTFYWFEHSWEKYKGIYKYNNLKELLKDIKKKFIQEELANMYHDDNIIIYEYKKPRYNISVQEFYKHCEKGNIIDLEQE